jgi:hypothetical protein
MMTTDSVAVSEPPPMQRSRAQALADSLRLAAPGCAAKGTPVNAVLAGDKLTQSMPNLALAMHVAYEDMVTQRSTATRKHCA